MGNLMRKKLLILLIVSAALAVTLTGCGKKALKVSGIISEILNKEGIKKSSVVSVGDYKKFKRSFSEIVFREDEFDRYIEENFGKYGELSDELVSEEFGFDSLEEFYEAKKEEYLNHLKIEQILEARDETINYLISIAEFELDDEEVANYSKQFVYSEQNYSLLFGYDSFDEYLKEERGMSEEAFLQECIENGTRELKKVLIIGAVSYKENLEEGIDTSDDMRFQDLENNFYDFFFE